MASAASTTAQCPNCSASLSGAYCSQCGQKVIALNPTFRDFLRDLAHELTDLDGKFLPTVRWLLTKPGFLSREHFGGRRARYVSPIRLYLIFSVLYFAVTAFAPLSGPEVHCTSCAADKKDEIEATMRAAIVEWFPRAMFVLMPIFAAFIALAARRSGRNYPQHLYFAMHVHAGWFFIAALAGVVAMIPIAGLKPAISAIGLVCIVTYAILAFRRAYDATVIRSVLSISIVGVLYWLLVIVALFSIVLPAALIHQK